MISKQNSTDLYSEILIGVRQLHESLENVSQTFRSTAYRSLIALLYVWLIALLYVWLYMLCLFSLSDQKDFSELH